MKYPGFLGASYVSKNRQADNEILMNLLIEKVESPGAKSPFILLPTPGLASRVDVGDNVETRARFAENGHVFTVIGNGLYEEFENRSSIRRGTLATDGNPATINSNGNGQLLITSGDHAYCYDVATTVLTTVRSSGARMGGVLNSYGLVLDALNGLVYFSAPGDLLTWDVLDFFARSIASDPLVALWVNNYGEAWLMGEQTSEVWEDTGDPSNPFTPRSNLVIPHGILAPFSMVTDDASMVWMGRNKAGAGAILAASSFNPEEISDSALSAALGEEREATRIDDAQAWGYEEDGHTHYVLNLPSADKTKVLDRKVNVWHDRGTWDVTRGRYGRWQANWHCYEWNQHLVGDATTGHAYRMSSALGLDVGGAPIRRVRRAPGINNERQRVTFDVFELYAQYGVGTQTGQGLDPTVHLKCSDDGGNTWWSAGARSLGKMGHFDMPMIWDRLGPSRNRVFELVMTDPAPLRIVDCYLKAQGEA